MNRSDKGRGIRRQIELPISEAIRISIQSIKIRFWRSLITTAGIFLGIAFFVSVLAGSAISEAMKKSEDITIGLLETESESGVSAQDIWLIVMSLIVCVVGIANSMLMAVAERFREIGTMKCLGALDRFVVELFLLESSFQGLSGALAGSIVGCLITVLLSLKNYGLNLFLNFPIWRVLLIIVMACVIGIVLAVIGAAGPAYRAAKLPPAEAMRVEI